MSLPNIKDFSYSEDSIRDYEVFLNRSFNLAEDNIFTWLFLYLTDQSVDGDKVSTGYKQIMIQKMVQIFQLDGETPLGNVSGESGVTVESINTLKSEIFSLLLEMYKNFPDYYHTVLDSVCTKKVFWQQLEEYFNVLLDPMVTVTTNPYEDSDELIF